MKGTLTLTATGVLAPLSDQLRPAQIRPVGRFSRVRVSPSASEQRGRQSRVVVSGFGRGTGHVCDGGFMAWLSGL